MGIEVNPRPNYGYGRVCGNCRFYLTVSTKDKKGFCILGSDEDITKISKDKLLPKKDTFAKVSSYTICDNHVYKQGNLLLSTIKYSGLKIDDIWK